MHRRATCTAVAEASQASTKAQRSASKTVNAAVAQAGSKADAYLGWSSMASINANRRCSLQAEW